MLAGRALPSTSGRAAAAPHLGAHAPRARRRPPPPMAPSAVAAPPEGASPPPAAGDAGSEVAIRRRPPRGVASQACGPVDFKVPVDADNAPRNILEEIVWYKAVEVEGWRRRQPLAALAALAKAAPPARDFIGALRAAGAASRRPGLIAEVKKASPSKGVIQPDFDAVRIARGYEAGGAACLSVLTDAKFFQGAFENLAAIRAAGVRLPLLAKEFIVEGYQLYKARAAGADAALLIAAVLPNADLAYLIKVARGLGLQCLVEVHTVEEMDRVLRLMGEKGAGGGGGPPSPLGLLEGCMLGINNRDLGTFKVSLQTTADIMASGPGRAAAAAGLLVAGESGIFTPADVAAVAGAGCGAILVGESLVKQGDPAAGVRALLA